MNKKYLMLFAAALAGGILSTAGVAGPEIKPMRFSAPLRGYELSLAGNFMEARPNHFHGGLDFKTQMAVGKPLYGIADGYVSRVTVGMNGFGNALYIAYPNGVTSIFGHLKKFSPKIEAALKAYQYRHETYECDMRLAPGVLPVKEGEVVAYSGNTGASEGPHLHLELHRTSNDEFLDPMPYFKHLFKDTTPPVAKALMVYPQRGEGAVNYGQIEQPVGLRKNGTTRVMKVWGRIGLGVMDFDFMDGTYNHYGVHKVELYCEGKKLFQSTTDGFLPLENRMVNSWGDLPMFRITGLWYMKSFIEPGNRLRVLWADNNRGIVNIDQERDYHFKYILTDHYGNRSVYDFTLRGEKQNIRPYVSPATRHRLMWNESNTVQEPGMQLSMPWGVLYDNLPMQVMVRQNNPAAVSPTYTFTKNPYPLNTWATLSIALRRRPFANPRQYYIVQRSRNGVKYLPSSYKNGWVSAEIRELGDSYTVETDNEAPTVRPVSMSGQTLRYFIQDTKSGIKTYKGKVDGRFVLFKNLGGGLSCDLSQTPVKRGGTHTLELYVEDNCGNRRTDRRTFNY